MKVPVQEVIAYLAEPHGCSSDIRLALLERLRTHGIAPPDGYAIVPIEDCDYCNNSGHISKGMLGIYRCDCYDKPNSRFNQNKAMLAAAPKRENSNE